MSILLLRYYELNRQIWNRENNVYKITYETKYSRMDQVKSVEDSL